jgi:hypothetical protein
LPFFAFSDALRELNRLQQVSPLRDAAKFAFPARGDGGRRPHAQSAVFVEQIKRVRNGNDSLFRVICMKS